MTIKAVGVVIDRVIRVIRDHGKPIGHGVRVRWVWRGPQYRVGQIEDKYPVRAVAVFREHHPDVQDKVIELLLQGAQAAPNQ